MRHDQPIAPKGTLAENIARRLCCTRHRQIITGARARYGFFSTIGMYRDKRYSTQNRCSLLEGQFVIHQYHDLR